MVEKARARFSQKCREVVRVLSLAAAVEGEPTMITKAVFTLFLCIPFTVVTETFALRVSFSESDSSVTESDRRASIRVTKSGVNQGDVICTLIPLSLDEAKRQYGYLPVGASKDPAEIGMDFSPAPVEHVFRPGIATVDEVLSIDVVDDTVYESDELLVVRLNVSVSDPLDLAELEIGIQYLQLRIVADSNDEPMLNVVNQASLSEGDGFVEDFFVVKKQAESELPLSFSIKVDTHGSSELGRDYELEIKQYTIFPNQSNITIPLRVIDDDIAEDSESFTVILLRPRTQAFLINIADNDVVTVRVGNSSEITVGEGGRVTLCAEIVSPAEVEREANILGTLMPGTAGATTDYVAVAFIGFALSGSNRRACQEVETVDDDIAEPSEFFSLSLGHFGMDPLVRVEPGTITFTVADDDDVMVQVTLPSPSDGSALTVTEGDSRTITVSIPEPNLIEVPVSVAVSPGSAEKDADFVIDVGTFILRPGNSSLELPLFIPDDQFVENEEHWTLVISQPNSTFPPQAIPITIIDNDAVTVGFVNDSLVRVVEGGEVRLCGKLADTTPSLLQREIVLLGFTVNGSATVGEDFHPLSWNFTFSSSSPGVQCVDVATINDSLPEIPEKFSARVDLATKPDPLISVQPSIVEIFIRNDDIPKLEVELVGETTPPTGGGGGGDLRAVVKEGDGLLDNLIRIYSPGVHPFPLEYHISITPSSADDVLVDVGTFTFAPSVDEVYVPVTVVDDEVAEDEEEVTIVISIPGQLPQVITLLIQDNDDVMVQVTLPGPSDGSALTVTEGDSHTITVSIPEPNLIEVPVSVAVSPGSAEKDADFVIDVGIFILRPGNSSLELPLFIPDDQFVENEEHWTLVISQPNSTFPPQAIPITIIDNDAVTVGFVNDSLVRVVEGGEVRLCGKLADATPSLLQREIVLLGFTVSGSATVGEDFHPLSWNFTFSSSSPGVQCVDVATINDSLPEIPEKFSARVDLATKPDPLISVQPSIVEIFIRNDDIPKLEVELVGETTPPTGGGGGGDLRAVVKEGDGLLDNLIRIYSPGVHPFPLEYHISITPSSADDVLVDVGTFTFAPSVDEVYVPVTVVDDEVAEDEEEVTIVISIPGQLPQVITLLIQDNDEVVVSGTGATVEEGKVARVCSCIISPRDVDRTIMVLARTVSLTATARVDYTPVITGLSLNGTRRTECFGVQTLSNDQPNPPREFEVQLEVRGQAAVRLERNSVTVTITDNDGTPLAPVITDIKLLEDGSGKGRNKSHNLTISWEASLGDELRPIDYFSGTVTLRGPSQSSSASGSSASTQSYNFSVDGNTTQHTVAVELAVEYTVQVCSWNSLGFNCSAPVSEVEKGENERLPAGVVVSIALLVLFVLICCCLCCLCLCLWCCRPSEWRNYHPERREKRYKKEFKIYRECHSSQVQVEVEVDSDFDSDLGDEV